MIRKTIGLILAGGKAKRFGGKKAFALVGDTPMILRVKSVLSRVCTEVWLSLRDEGQPENFFALHFKKVVYDEAAMGPLSGILRALRELRVGDVMVVAPCDQPFLKEKLLRGLLSEFLKAEEAVAGCCLNEEEEPEPFPLVLSKDALYHLRDFSNASKPSLKLWLKSLSPKKFLGISKKVWYAWDGSGESFINVNTQEDLRRLILRTPQ